MLGQVKRKKGCLIKEKGSLSILQDLEIRSLDLKKKNNNIKMRGMNMRMSGRMMMKKMMKLMAIKISKCNSIS